MRENLREGIARSSETEKAVWLVKANLQLMAAPLPEIQTDTQRESAITHYTKRALKRLRVSQPFNYLATSAVHWLLASTGLQSELIIKRLRRVGMVRRRLPNGRTLRLWSRADDWVSNQIYWRGWSGYEPETVPLFFRLATHARVTLDVGAYVGFYTLLAAHANPTGQVYAFEPLLSVYERLQWNVMLNGLTNV